MTANIMSFGAVGDGVHDDTAARDQAFSTIPSGGRLYLPGPAQYLFSTMTSAYERLTIEGDGPETSVIRYSGTGAAVRFAGIAFAAAMRDCSILNVNPAGPTAGIGLQLVGSRLVHISRVRVDAFNANVALQTSTTYACENNTLEHIIARGSTTPGAAGLYITGAPGLGVNYNLMRNFHAVGNDYGVFMNPDGGTINFNTFVGGSFAGSKTQNIYVDGLGQTFVGTNADEVASAAQTVRIVASARGVKLLNVETGGLGIVNNSTDAGNVIWVN